MTRPANLVRACRPGSGMRLGPCLCRPECFSVQLKGCVSVRGGRMGGALQSAKQL